MPPKARALLPEDRHGAIAERAYYKAQARGFVPGFELDDWLEAEREVAALAKAAPKPRAKRGGKVGRKT